MIVGLSFVNCPSYISYIKYTLKERVQSAEVLGISIRDQVKTPKIFGKQLRLMFFNNNGGNAGSGNDETVTQFDYYLQQTILCWKKTKRSKTKNIKQKSKRKTWWRFGVSGIEASQPSGDKK